VNNTDLNHLSLVSQLLALGVPGYVFLGLFGASTIGQIVWLSRDSQRRINAEAFAMQIRKLLAANNEDRALKLSRAHDGPVARLTRLGVQARINNENPANAVQDAMPTFLDEARSGLVPVSMLGGLTVAVGALTMLSGASKGLGASFMGPMGVALAVMAAVSVRNGLRWNSWSDELNEAARAVIDS
jgi:hypothetical protein